MSECHCPCRGIATDWHNYVYFVDGMLTCCMLGPISPANFTVCMISIKLNQCVPGYIPPSFPHKTNHVPIRCSRSCTTWSVTSGPASNGCCKSLRPWGCAVAGWCCLMLFDWWGSHALNHFHKLIWIIYADICRPVRFVCVFSEGLVWKYHHHPWPRSRCSGPFPRLSARHESDWYAG